MYSFRSPEKPTSILAPCCGDKTQPVLQLEALLTCAAGRLLVIWDSPECGSFVGLVAVKVLGARPPPDDIIDPEDYRVTKHKLYHTRASMSYMFRQYFIYAELIELRIRDGEYVVQLAFGGATKPEIVDRALFFKDQMLELPGLEDVAAELVYMLETQIRT